MFYKERYTLAKQMVEAADSLPTIPAVAMKVSSLLNDPDVNLEEVADTILTDQVLAARVIKVVNSPLFRPANEIGSVKQALVRLGTYQIRDIVVTCSIISSMEEKRGVIDVRSFWEHSFGVGILARIIAEKVHYRDIEKAYLVGILHDIGQVFLNHYHPEGFRQVIAQLNDRPGKIADVETQIIGVSHCEIGAVLAERWHFPADYCDVMAHHHAPSNSEVDSALVAIVNLADLFCSVRGLGIESVESWVTFKLNDEGSWRILQGIVPDINDLDVERFCFEIDDKIEGIKDLVRSVFDKAM